MDGRAGPKIRNATDFGTWYGFSVRDLFVQSVVRIFLGSVRGPEIIWSKIAKCFGLEIRTKMVLIQTLEHMIHLLDSLFGTKKDTLRLNSG